MLESRSKADLKVEDPLIIWLRGEAGCSPSEFLFGDAGPYVYQQSNKDDVADKLKKNGLSWNIFSNVLIFDLPIGSGYSFRPFRKDRPENDQRDYSRG